MIRQTILDTAKRMEISLSAGQEAVLRLIYGLPITDPEQIRLALKATGRESLGAARHYVNNHVLAGRRSGKSTRLVALVAIHESFFAGHEIPEHETAYLPIIAPVESQARKTFKTILKLIEKHLPTQIIGEPRFSVGEAEIELSSGVVIQVMAARANAARGGTNVAVIYEEACHFGREDKSAHPLSEIVGSLLPSLLTHSSTHAKQLFVSSPWVKSGVMFEAFRDRAQNEDSTLVVSLPSRDFNPSLNETAMALQRKLQGESWFQREYMSEFVDSGESLIPPAAIDEAVVPGTNAFLPTDWMSSVAGFDMSARGDDSALGIAHKCADEVIQLDFCQLWKRPVGEKTINPFVVLESAVTTMKAYRVARAFSDQVLQSVVEHHIKQYGITHERRITYGNGAAEMWRIVRELFVTGRVRIPDNKQLIQQLKNLEMQFVDGGGQAVGARRGKDDVAVAAALAIWQAYEDANVPEPWFEALSLSRAAQGTREKVKGGTDTGWVTVSGRDSNDCGDFGRTDLGGFPS